jgi:chaperonin GroES
MRPEYSKVTAVGTRIVVKVAELEEKTAKGIFLPDSAQKKPTSGDVVSVGKGGKKFDLTLKEGDTVLYSKFGLGVIDVEVAGVEYAILNERDCMGIMPRSNASVEDIGEIKPLGDRVLIKVDTAAEESAGGVLLTDSAKEKPMSGQVMAVGPGRLDENTGKVHSMKLKPGDRVTFFKWAGDAVETPAGLSYNILNESDVLCTH